MMPGMALPFSLTIVTSLSPAVCAVTRTRPSGSTSWAPAAGFTVSSAGPVGVAADGWTRERPPPTAEAVTVRLGGQHHPAEHGQYRHHRSQRRTSGTTIQVEQHTPIHAGLKQEEPQSRGERDGSI